MYVSKLCAVTPVDHDFRMAVMEHAYYACTLSFVVCKLARLTSPLLAFGYQVTNFFAASSRYGGSPPVNLELTIRHSGAAKVPN